MKKYVQSKLSRQLVLVVTIACSVILLSIGVILPKSLLPVYEKNLYNYLKQPLELVSDDIEENPISNEIAYIYMYEDVISVSENLGKIVRFADVYKLTNYFTEKYGKFIYKAHIYYYYTSDSNSVKRVALTNDSYIRQAREDALHSVFPIVFITMLVVSLMLVIWSSLVVRRIEKLKKKIDHIDDDTYNHQVEDSELDEIYSLEQAIEDMRLTLKNQEEYRNQMYQNISHDFKTPLAVIKSYIEAVEDQVEDANKALPIIQEQTLKLENKVHSLLYLNKLDYIRERN
ncbi:MAG: HAMP domain-containing histidine kinase, partial [Bacilli bacterium]|nr:HAMP domain-containing histidine kinase [Bacilli bacterium]